VASLMAVAALLGQQSRAHGGSIIVLGPMAPVFLSRLACILADLAAGFANDARHSLFSFEFC